MGSRYLKKLKEWTINPHERTIKELGDLIGGYLIFLLKI
jgi:hypothetical protein